MSMTAKAYQAYVTECKKRRIRPSSLAALTHDPLESESEHVYEPIHIRVPRDYTGRVKSISQQLRDLPEDKKFLITKKQLIEFEQIIRGERV